MRLASRVVIVMVVGLSWVGSALGQAAAPPSPPPPLPPPAYPPPGAYPQSAYPYPPSAYTYPPQLAPPPPVAEKKLGVGYKIGNGLGFIGADVIIAPVEHVALDAQVNYLSNDGATGTGFAAVLQGRLYGNQRSTPYLGLGFVHASLTLGSQTGSLSGVLANLGYEWRWNEGLGILLGGGIAHVPSFRVSDGVRTVDDKGGWLPNVFFGIRYLFLLRYVRTP
jgi:hypothetical protein